MRCILGLREQGYLISFKTVFVKEQSLGYKHPGWVEKAMVDIFAPHTVTTHTWTRGKVLP